jgi:CO dehydrogenase/acetyl-CoA synthase beta subunit
VKPILRTLTTWTVKQEEEEEEEEQEEAMCRPFPCSKASPGTQIPEMTG